MKHLRPLVLALCLAIAGTSALTDPLSAAPTTTYHDISGRVTDSAGNPVAGATVMVQSMSRPTDYPTTNSSGSYTSYGYSEGESINLVRVYSLPSGYGSPDPAGYFDFVVGPGLDDLDFTAQIVVPVNDAVVRGVVYSPYWDQSDLEGVRITVNGQIVATTNGAGGFSFQPVLLDLPEYGLVQAEKSFHTILGSNQSYDISSGVDYQLTNMAITKTDLTDFPHVTYSWNDPGDEGYQFFISTPDNRVPNNPDLYVKLDFDGVGLSTTVPADQIRLRSATGTILPSGGVTAEADLTGPNWIAEFRVPVGENQCERLELFVEVGRMDGGTFEWQAINAPFASGTSDLDLEDDDVINLGDLVIYAPTINTYEGHPNFNPCADYYPDGVINTSDTAIFAPLFTSYQSSKSVSQTPGSSATLQNSDSEIRVAVRSVSAWDIALIRMSNAKAGESKVEWMADAGFDGSSHFIAGKDGTYTLMVYQSHASLSAECGSLQLDSGIDSDNWRIDSVQTVSSAEYLSGDENRTTVPEALDVGFQAAPNPFNPQTTLRFSNPREGKVCLQVYDVNGRLVRTLVDGPLPAGAQEYTWNGRDNQGRHTATGVYFAKLRTGDGERVQKLVLLK